jgi:hypothetical protein
MTEHFTKSTVSAAFYCGKCGKTTQHRIDHFGDQAGRKGPCLECLKRYDEAPKKVEPTNLQRKLFGEAT